MSKKMGIVRSFRLLLWIVVCIAFVIGLGFKVQAKLNAAEANIRALAEEKAISYPVTTTLLKSERWETRRSYYGQVKASRTQEITPFEREIVKDVHVQVGDKVKAGQLLITLHTADRSAKVQASRTGYDEAQLNYKRLSELFKKGGVSQSEVDRAYAALKSEEAQLKTSQSTLQRTEIRASINGIVSARNVEPGELAEAGRSMLSILDPSEMEAQIMVSKKDIFNIGKNTSVDIYVDGEKYPGWVKRSSPEAQSGSGLYPVTVGISADGIVLPGSYVEGSFLVSSKPEAISIPSEIVIYRGKSKSVYVADGNVARQVVIETGEGQSDRVIVTSGLKAGDEVIVSGNRALYDGAPIAKNIDFGEDKMPQ